ncbi:MAG: hypothetical protein LBB76_08575 [Azoarcus sp.]|jgi:hypothetical protein|nr:hypothetical protein [Azoarcus sp.]
MQAHRLPARHGWYWLRDGFLLWQSAPGLCVSLGFSSLFALTLVGSIPYLGQPLVQFSLPVFVLLILNLIDLIARGKPLDAKKLARIGTVFQSRRDLVALITVGIIYLLANMLIIRFSAQIDGGIFRDIILKRRELDPLSMELPAFRAALLISLGLLMPILMACWFTPPLIGWWHHAPAKAMFFSLLACLRNWRAFSVYALASFSLGLLLPVFIAGVLEILIPGMGVLALLLWILAWLIPVVFASFHASIRDIFGLPENDCR